MNLCYFLANQIHLARARKRTNAPLERRSSQDAYWQWQCESSPKYFDKFFDLRARLPDSRVIDIGCGLGGRTCYLAMEGIREAVGVDINQQEVAQAQGIMQRLGNMQMREKVRFHTVSEIDALADEVQFDIVLLVDALEHVQHPMETLNQAHALLRPGGVCYFSTWGWYHHQASHVGSIIPIPFATLLFSDKQILDAVRKVVEQPYYVPSMWDSNPPALRWQGCNSLHDRPGEYLNKFTIHKFRKAMAASEFRDWELKVEGFSGSGHRVLSMFNFLARVPVVQEVFHSAIFGRLIKADG